MGSDDRPGWLSLGPVLLCGVVFVGAGLILPTEQWLLLFCMMVAYVVPPL